MSAIRTAIRREEGVAIVIAMGVLLTTLVLAAAAFATATQIAGTSTKDQNTKRALEAAQAGINVAIYRFGHVSPSIDSCVTDRASAWTFAAHCGTGTVGQLGNGASYKYWVTPQFSSVQAGVSQVASECGGASVERCVTSVGTANGVSRRLQVRVKTPSLFPTYLGLTGLTSLDIEGNPNWRGSAYSVLADVGTNGTLTYKNNVVKTQAPYFCYLGPVATGTCSNPSRLAQPLTLASVDTLQWLPGLEGTLTVAQGYNAATNTLAVPAGTTLSLASGDYRFCSVTVGNAGTIIAPAGRVRIFVDSPARGGSSCGAGLGTFTAGIPSGGQGGATAQLNPGAGNANLEIYLYGTNAPSPPGTAPPPATCASDFRFQNGAPGFSSNLYIYGPNSFIDIESSQEIGGAVAGCSTRFFGDAPTATFSHSHQETPPVTKPTPVPSSFRECTGTYSGDPEAGCYG